MGERIHVNIQELKVHPLLSEYMPVSGYGNDYQPLLREVEGQFAEGGFGQDEYFQFLDALEFAEDCYRGVQKREFRHSGDHVMTHMLWMVHRYLKSGRRDIDVIQAILLHDTHEDLGMSVEEYKEKYGETKTKEELEQLYGKAVSIEEIETRFGGKVARIVDAVSKIKSSKLDRGEYVDFDQLQHETNWKLFEPLLEKNGDIRRATPESILLAEKVFTVKDLDTIHNLATIEFHENLEKALTKATLADDYMVPMSFGLGIDDLAVDMENLAFEILHPDTGSVLEHLLAKYNEDFKTNVKQWIREKLVPLDIPIGHVSLLPPRLKEMIDADLEADEVPTLIIEVATEGAVDKESVEKAKMDAIRFMLFLKTMSGEEKYDQFDLVPGSYTPWKKRINLGGQPVDVQVAHYLREENRLTGLVQWINKELELVSKSEFGLEYMLIAAEFMNWIRNIPTIKVELETESGSRAENIEQDSTALDLMYKRLGIPDVLALEALRVRRGTQEQVQLLPGDTLLDGDVIEEVIYDTEINGPFSKLDEFRNPGAVVRLRQWLNTHKDKWQDYKDDIRIRGEALISWLYGHLKNKRLDVHLLSVLSDDVKRLEQMYDVVGTILKSGGGERNFRQWEMIAMQYESLPDETLRQQTPQIQGIVAAFRFVNEVMRYRERCPVLWINIEEQEGVMSFAASTWDELKMSSPSLRANPRNDPLRPGNKPEIVEVVFRPEDRDQIETLVEQIRDAYPDCEVWCEVPEK
jgi:hypothetical protein